MKTLVVDDDLALADVISFTMRRAGYDVILAHDGQAALDRWEKESPDLVILDLNLPKLDGLTVCRRIRAQSDTPILILSVRDDEEDIVTGLQLGADDYIVKPFSPRQLVARVEAVLRRSSALSAPAGPITAGMITLDPSRNELYWGERSAMHLTRLESRLLEVLMRNRNHVIPTDTLIGYVWGPLGGDRIMLKQLIYRLRRKLEEVFADSVVLDTVSGVGYTLKLK